MTKRKSQNTLATLNITLPKRWGDLSADQVSRVAYYLSMQTTEIMYLLMLAAELADLQPRGTHVMPDGEIRYLYYNRKAGNIILSAEHVTSICDAMKWTLSNPEPMAAPLINGHKTPDRDLYDITLEQFITADTAYAAYIGLSDIRALRMMVAALYPRKAFDPERLQAEADRLVYLPEWKLQAVMIWYTGAKKALQKKYPYVFSTENSDGQPVSGGDMLMGLLSSLNDGRVVDNQKIKQTEVHEVFYELNLKIKHSKKD